MHFFGLKVRLHSRNHWKRFSKALSCSVWSLPKTMESSRMSGVIHCFVKNILCRDYSIIHPCVPHLTLSSVKGVHVPAAFVELKLMVSLIHIKETEDSGTVEFELYVLHSKCFFNRVQNCSVWYSHI